MDPTLVLETRACGAGELACLALSACGARLAAGGGGGGGRGELRAWAWAAGEGWAARGGAARAHRLGVCAVRWAAGGALLASGGGDGALRVWAVLDGTLVCRRELAAPGAEGVRALAWLGAGRGARLAAGHADGRARVWAVGGAGGGAGGGALLARLEAHAGALQALAVLARGALLLTACTQGTLKVFDLVELCSRDPDPEEEVAPLGWIDGAHDMGALCADAAPGGGLVATGGHDARVRLWSVHPRAGGPPGGAEAPGGPEGAGGTLSSAGALAGHSAAVTALCWGARGVLGSASLDRSARLWAAAAGECLHVVHAHARYLTCIALAPDLRFMITGSNDRSIRTWSLGAFSLDAELQAPCNALAHFALGDLEGIGPVDADEDAPGSERAPQPRRGGGDEEEHSGGGGTCCVWRTQAHSGAINCIAASGEFLSTASSDGTVKVWRWSREGAALSLEHALEAHRYPALACDFGAAGSVLLSAGLDGRAFLWDVQSGVQVRALSVPRAGGVRGARLSARRPLRALLATDDGLAPLWTVAEPNPQPSCVYGDGGGAASCCAWAADARLCAVGGAGGELRVLHHDPCAHDLGVTSCDFGPTSAALELPEGGYLLATAGNDSLIKLWTIELREEEGGEPRARVQLARQVKAHGGGAACVRWEGEGPGHGAREGEGEALLASAGGDRWARVWGVRARGGAVSVRARAALAGGGAGGARAALPVRAHLAVGAHGGELALWRLAGAGGGGAGGGEEEEEDPAPRYWREAGVARWLKDYVSRSPDARLPRSREAALLRRAREARLAGARLLDAPVADVVASLGYGDDVPAEDEGEAPGEGEGPGERAAVRARIEDELAWLRAEPPDADLALRAPHALLCPLTHALLRWPTRAADGFTYERDNIQEWLLAAPPEGAVSPVTGRRMRNTHLAPNYKLRQTLRDWLRQQALERHATREPTDAGRATPEDS